jgi:hypothetical protein
MTAQGAKANQSGATAEQIVSCLLQHIDHRHQVIIGRSIYGHPLRVDFVIDGLKDFPQGLALEIKRQGRSGSVDEKIPYAIANIKEAFPMPGILVLDGSGMKPGCRRWAKKQVGGNVIAVLDIVELAGWIQSHINEATQ